jgi:hypothetical protein
VKAEDIIHLLAGKKLYTKAITELEFLREDLTISSFSSFLFIRGGDIENFCLLII